MRFRDLGRGALISALALGFATEQWQRAGLWVVTRSDPDYPRDRFKKIGRAGTNRNPYHVFLASSCLSDTPSREIRSKSLTNFVRGLSGSSSRINS